MRHRLKITRGLAVGGVAAILCVAAPATADAQTASVDAQPDSITVQLEGLLIILPLEIRDFDFSFSIGATTVIAYDGSLNVR